MTDIDIARSTISIYGDTITVTGNNAMTHSQFSLGHFTLQGEKLGAIIYTEDEREKFSGMFQLNTVKFQNRALVTGRGDQYDLEYGLVYVMNNQNELDALITFEP
jgi:hypothetical protein